jgi:hypothetical protein
MESLHGSFLNLLCSVILSVTCNKINKVKANLVPRLFPLRSSEWKEPGYEVG